MSDRTLWQTAQCILIITYSKHILLKNHMKTSREERSKSIFEKNELWCFSNRRIQPEHSGGDRLKIFQF